MSLIDKAKKNQETAEDGMAGLQSKFQNLNTKVNQMLTDGQTDERTDRRTDRQMSSIHKPELLCNLANNYYCTNVVFVMLHKLIKNKFTFLPIFITMLSVIKMT